MIGLDDLLARGRPHALGPGLGEVEEIAELPQLVERGAGHPQIEQLGDPAGDVVETIDAERGGHALARAERVDEDGRVEALHVLEEQGHVASAPALRHAVGDLGDLQVTRDRRAHPLEPALLLEVGDELAEIGEGHDRPSTRGSTASRATRPR
jgi:hypothetical protein